LALLIILALAMVAVVACAGDEEPTPTKEPIAMMTAPPTKAPTAIPKPVEVEIKDVPRNRVLQSFLGGSEGRFVDHTLWNPYAIGANHQSGPNIIFEPLAFYSAFADETIPWLAEKWSWNSDYTELTINLRKGINWSDGEEFNADDVVYTLNTLKELKEEVRWGTDIANVLDVAEKVDSHTVKCKLSRPDPRFMFLLTYKYDIGVYMVPEHHYAGRDWPTFEDYDPAQGWPITTSPWKVVSGTPEQKIIDNEYDWWGDGVAGLGRYGKTPRVDRVIYLPSTGDQTLTAQALIGNEVDYASMTTPATIAKTLEQNDKLDTFSKRDSPYGYVDWWPVSLAFNDSGKFGPYDDPNVRWAFSYYLDREQLADVAYDGAAALNPLTMPGYPPLMKYFEAVEDILEEYDTTEHNPAKGDKLLTDAGFTKNADGMWADAQGNTINCEIIGFTAWVDLGPITAEQLRLNGINASYIQPPDASSRMAEGNFECLMFGHGGSVRDPYFTMKLYQSASVNIPGGHQVNFYHWENAEFDRLTDEVAKTHPDDVAAVQDLFHQAMEIWIPEIPDVPVLEFYHRIVRNHTYWTKWPNTNDPYVNEASWHLTWPLVLHTVEPTQ